MSWKEDLIELGRSRGYFTIVESRINYPHAGKNYQWEPEEEARAAVYTELIVQHHYPVDRIRFEVNMPAQDKPADVVVYSDDACTEPFLSIELKKVGCTKSEFGYCCDQLHRNGNALRAKFGAAIAGEHRRKIWRLEGFPPNEREANRVSSLPVAYSDPDALWYKKGVDDQELSSLSRRDLITRFNQCHQILWENGRRTPEICLYEMSKIIFAKFNDEKYTDPDEYYTFQRGRGYSDNDTAGRVRALFRDMCNRVPDIFEEKAINIPDKRLALIVDKLQDARLYHSVFDPMGQAFDAYIGTHMRGPLGQFFTPRDVVDFMIYLTEPSLDDHILDPACGTGGALHAWDSLLKKFGGPSE
jgi:type I restriction enzyme M protein